MKPTTTVYAALLLIGAFSCNPYSPKDWGTYDVLRDPPSRASLPDYGGGPVPDSLYKQWVYLGEEWFRGETFGNERVFTDIVGLLNGTVDVPNGPGAYGKESVFKLFLQAVDALDGVAGNLFTGNGGGYTSDLVIAFPKGTMLDGSLPVPEKLHTGLDVEAGSPWPLGIVIKKAAPDEEALPYLLDPAKFAAGPRGVGPLPGGGKFRAGASCALCHYSLDIDWDGKADLKSAKPTQPTEGSPYKPYHAWAIGNQDVHLGWIFALSGNELAGFENTGLPGKTEQKDAREWADKVLASYKANPGDLGREVNRGLIMMPRGFADDTPDGLHNPLQFPSLFTHLNWPFNIDGVMLNPSDRNNNVWTTGLDLTQIVALCKDRGGKELKILFWEEKGLYSRLTAEEYADIIVSQSPAVKANSSQRRLLIDDILGTSDGVPGLLSSDAVVLIKGVPGAIPKEVFQISEKAGRVRSPEEFGDDGKERGPMVGLLGTRVVTPPSVRAAYDVEGWYSRYKIAPDEFVTEAIRMMLDWVEPPPNTSALLGNARSAGLVDKGYEVFKQSGCASCHAGPILTDNLIHPRKEIGTNTARVDATKLLQTLAPPYDPQTGKAQTGGILGIISNLFGEKKPGYKTLTLRYLWGSAPYLHDGGVAVAIRPGDGPAGDDLKSLLSRSESSKVYGVGQILDIREARPETYLRADAALSLQALLLKSEREKVVAANTQRIYPIPGTNDSVAVESLQIQGIGHDYYVEDQPGGENITALVAFLLALDDEPGR